MSLKLMTKAFDIRVGNHLRKLVLIKLADNANDQGECWPSYGYIAEQCECSRSAVREHIAALINMGLVQKENRIGSNAGMGNKSNIYSINFDNPVPSESIPLEPPVGTPVPCADTPMLSESTAPVACGGTRICHSFEPVKEPAKEPKDIGEQAEARTPAKRVNLEYSPEFEDVWRVYPRRIGGNSKAAAWKAWKARIREGASPDAILAGVTRYAAFITATGKSGTEYIKQASSFFGPNRHFDEPWTLPVAPHRQTTSQQQHSGFDSRDYGHTQTPAWGRGHQ